MYKTAVMSLLTCGCEAWALTTKTSARINGVNARCLSRITGSTAHQEASRRTQTFDIITAIKKRKWKWLGHLLRLPNNKDGTERLVKTALRVQFNKNDKLNMLQGIPKVETFEELIELAQCRKRWRKIQPTGQASSPKPSATKTKRSCTQEQSSENNKCKQEQKNKYNRKQGDKT